jgi:hypothetical protein
VVTQLDCFVHLCGLVKFHFWHFQHNCGRQLLIEIPALNFAQIVNAEALTFELGSLAVYVITSLVFIILVQLLEELFGFFVQGFAKLLRLELRELHIHLLFKAFLICDFSFIKTIICYSIRWTILRLIHISLFLVLFDAPFFNLTHLA